MYMLFCFIAILTGAYALGIHSLHVGAIQYTGPALAYKRVATV